MGVRPHPSSAKEIAGRVLKDGGKPIWKDIGLKDQGQKRAHYNADYEAPHKFPFPQRHTETGTLGLAYARQMAAIHSRIGTECRAVLPCTLSAAMAGARRGRFAEQGREAVPWSAAPRLSGQALSAPAPPLTFSFASPIQAFGAYFSGVQNFTTDTVNFSDGTSQVLDIPEAGTSSSTGALDFVGFTDAGKSISSVTISAGTSGFDDIGVDDVRFGPVSAVPEPLTLSIFGAGVVGAAVLRRRKQKTA
jgi:hypothetical protein